MFNFEVCQDVKDETVSKLISDDVVYITYWRTDMVYGEINTYVTRLDKSGLLRRDYFPLYSRLMNFFDAFTIMYAGAK